MPIILLLIILFSGCTIPDNTARKYIGKREQPYMATTASYISKDGLNRYPIVYDYDLENRINELEIQRQYQLEYFKPHNHEKLPTSLIIAIIFGIILFIFLVVLISLYYLQEKE